MTITQVNMLAGTLPHHPQWWGRVPELEHLAEAKSYCHMLLLTANGTYRLAKRCQSSPQQCYIHHL